VAERDAALHAARALLAQLGDRERADELLEIADTLARIALGRVLPRHLDECADAAHYAAASDSFVTKPAPPEESGASS
jgi:hypothetical protein